MGGKRIAEQVRRALIVALAAAPLGCTSTDTRTQPIVQIETGPPPQCGVTAVCKVIPNPLATCVNVCEKEKSCAGPAQAGRDCQRFCTRRGADAGWFGLGSAGVSTSCDSSNALLKLSACVDRGCAGLEDCEACVCGDLSRCSADSGAIADGG